MLRVASVAFTASLPLLVASAALAESSTIRIEPRPYYGATVTVEQGVRVWRPLPTTRHVIVNPNNTPLNLSIADVRETVTHNHTGPIVAPPAAHGSPSTATPYYLYGRPYGARLGGRGGHHGAARPRALSR